MGAEPLRVLVVEDEAMLALDLEDILHDLGHEVVGAVGNVGQAMAFVDACGSMPDAAIVDANLGGESSRPVADALASRDVYVVMASGYTSGELARLGFGSPSISKPYSRDDVRSALRDVQKGGLRPQVADR